MSNDLQQLLSYLRDPQKTLEDRMRTLLQKLGNLTKANRIMLCEELLEEAQPAIARLQSLASQIENHLAAIRSQK